MFSQVFVKGRRLDFLSDENENLFWTDVQGKHIFPSATDFESMVRSYLDNNMGIKLAKDDDLLKILWFESTSPFVQDETSTSKIQLIQLTLSLTIDNLQMSWTGSVPTFGA